MKPAMHLAITLDGARGILTIDDVEFAVTNWRAASKSDFRADLDMVDSETMRRVMFRWLKVEVTPG